jgi:Ca2+-transporting ATPase
VEFLILIFLVLGISFIFAKLLEKFNLPRIIAPISLGIAFNYFNWIEKSNYVTTLDFLSSLAIMMLLFFIGLELNLKDVKKQEKETFLVAIFGFFISFILGFLSFYFIFDQSFLTSFIIASILSVTAESIVIVILEQNKLLSSRVGEVVMGAGIIDDIAGIILLAIISVIATSQDFVFLNYMPVLIGLAIFVLGMIFLKYVSKFIDYVFMSKNFKVYDVFTCSIIFLFLFATISHFAGLDISLGTIVFGLLLNFSLNKVGKKGIAEEHDINRFVKNITFGFLSYFFFFWIGFNFEISMFLDNWYLGIFFALVAFVAKYFGGLVASYLSRDTFSNGSLIGIGMATKGGVELIIAEIARKTGLISIEIFSAIVFMSLVLTILCPIIFNLLVKFKTLKKYH